MTCNQELLPLRPKPIKHYFRNFGSWLQIFLILNSVENDKLPKGEPTLPSSYQVVEIESKTAAVAETKGNFVNK